MFTQVVGLHADRLRVFVGNEVTAELRWVIRPHSLRDGIPTTHVTAGRNERFDPREVIDASRAR